MFSIDFSILSSNDLRALAIEKLGTNPEEWEKNIWQFIANWFDPGINSVTVFSSGSTGVPRAIQHTKETMLVSAEATCQALGLQPGNSALLCLPADKISGIMMLVRSLHLKMRLYCLKPSISIFNEIEINLTIDFAAFTPMQFSEILLGEKQLQTASNIRKIILGGEGIQPALIDKIKTLPNEVYATFGMTETISHIALKKLNGKHPDKHYKILPGITTSVDERNCLVIEAPGLLQNPLVTNDVVNLISDTEFDWLGRADNVINSGGIKIYPELVESLLSPQIKIPFFIAGIPDAKYGEKLVLALEAIQLSGPDKAEITTAIKQLPKHQQPKEILLILHFVRTANGKLKRENCLTNVKKYIAI